MSDGDLGGYGGGTGRPLGRVYSTFLGVVSAVACVVVLVQLGLDAWPLVLLFAAATIFFPLMGWVFEPRIREWSKRLPWRRL